MAESTEAKVDLAGQLVNKVREAGISLDDLYIDPLVYPAQRPMQPLRSRPWRPSSA